MRERQIRAFDILERDLGFAMKSAPQPLRYSAITLTDAPVAFYFDARGRKFRMHDGHARTW